MLNTASTQLSTTQIVLRRASDASTNSPTFGALMRAASRTFILSCIFLPSRNCGERTPDLTTSKQRVRLRHAVDITASGPIPSLLQHRPVAAPQSFGGLLRWWCRSLAPRSYLRDLFAKVQVKRPEGNNLYLVANEYVTICNQML